MTIAAGDGDDIITLESGIDFNVVDFNVQIMGGAGDDEYHLDAANMRDDVVIIDDLMTSVDNPAQGSGGVNSHENLLPFGTNDGVVAIEFTISADM